MRRYFLIMFFINIIYTERHDWGVNNQVDLITDMSETCVDDLHTDVYLPFGMGVADANVIIVSDNDLYPNCIITFHSVGVKEGVYVIVVVEFPDHTEGLRNACQDDGSTVMIEETHNDNVDVCDAVNRMNFGYYSTATYSILSNSSNISVILSSKSLFETVKITATSARKLDQYEKCDTSSEVICSLANSTVCISIELQCDENINCGSPTLNDEDVRICDETRYNKLWLVVLTGTIMLIIIVFFLIHLLRTCLPSVPDSFFIFNEDEDNKLILSTKYTAPPESLRQTLLMQKLPAATSSSFRFKNVPINDRKSFPYMQQIHTSENRDSFSDAEVELESHLYKSEIKKEVEGIVDRLPIDTDETTPTKLNLKKPRFEEANFINIMDRIDLPSHTSKPHQSTEVYGHPSHSKHKKSSLHARAGTIPESHKKDKSHSPTFSVEEKHRRHFSKE